MRRRRRRRRGKSAAVKSDLLPSLEFSNRRQGTQNQAKMKSYMEPIGYPNGKTSTSCLEFLSSPTLSCFGVKEMVRGCVVAGHSREQDEALDAFLSESLRCMF